MHIINISNRSEYLRFILPPPTAAAAAEDAAELLLLIIIGWSDCLVSTLKFCVGQPQCTQTTASLSISLPHLEQNMFTSQNIKMRTTEVVRTEKRKPRSSPNKSNRTEVYPYTPYSWNLRFYKIQMSKVNGQKGIIPP